jgi:hypothetical protein
MDKRLLAMGAYFTKEQWALIPLKLKQRWWDETVYGTVYPSDELQEAIRCALGQDIASRLLTGTSKT